MRKLRLAKVKITKNQIGFFNELNLEIANILSRACLSYCDDKIHYLIEEFPCEQAEESTEVMTVFLQKGIIGKCLTHLLSLM